jgi:hypothetical protein
MNCKCCGKKIKTNSPHIESLVECFNFLSLVDNPVLCAKCAKNLMETYRYATFILIKESKEFKKEILAIMEKRIR